MALADVETMDPPHGTPRPEPGPQGSTNPVRLVSYSPITYLAYSSAEVVWFFSRDEGLKERPRQDAEIREGPARFSKLASQSKAYGG